MKVSADPMEVIGAIVPMARAIMIEAATGIAAHEGTTPGGDRMIPTLRLPGGAALVAETVEGARSFAVGFWFPLGSRHEAPHERGFVHFVEHMVFKGTLKRAAAAFAR